MSKENLVSIEIPDSDAAKIAEALNTVKTVLKPYLVSISTEERQTLPKMNEKTVPFVKKVLDYAGSHPEFAPSYLSVPELKKDVDAFEALIKIGKPLEEIAVAITDTTILCGSEAYTAALSYYNAVKQAVRQNVPGAKVIFDDLKTKFEANGTRTKTAGTSAAKA